MHADTDAIRAYGGATTDLAADTATVAALLRRDLSTAVTAAFGPVGNQFAAALTQGAADLAKAVRTVGESLDVSGAATTAAAGDYDQTEAHSRTEIARAGM
ncbi:MAG TPA: hypothetical protein VH496_05485 [Mycobacterium sp.]|jgi:hypothetical protein